MGKTSFTSSQKISEAKQVDLALTEIHNSIWYLYYL